MEAALGVYIHRCGGLSRGLPGRTIRAMSERAEFRTTLEHFTGPLDLLLYLIRKDEIDILDIPIARILAQYEEYVQLLKDIDVNLASDYLVMATTLMEIKSRMLLPQAQAQAEEEELEDPRENLVKQLLEYRTYKERALCLSEKLQENARRFRRGPAELPFELQRIELGSVTMWDIVTAFMRVQKAVAADQPRDIVYTARPLSFYMELIQDVFDRCKARDVAFEKLFLDRGPLDRYTLIGTFLAVLELVKLGALGLARNADGGGLRVLLRLDSLRTCMHSLAQHAHLDAEGAAAPAEEPSAPEGEEAPVAPGADTAAPEGSDHSPPPDAHRAAQPPEKAASPCG